MSSQCARTRMSTCICNQNEMVHLPIANHTCSNYYTTSIFIDDSSSFTCSSLKRPHAPPPASPSISPRPTSDAMPTSMTSPVCRYPTTKLSVVSSLFSLALPNPRTWLVSLARASIHTVLEQAITKGSLTIHDSEGTYGYGHRQTSYRDVHLTVVNNNFWTRVFASGDIGFSEAYMMGDVRVEDIGSVMHLWLDNQAGMENLSTLSKVSSVISGLSNAFLGQSHAQSRLNAIASYDQSNDLFKSFLSEEMMYSCALWDRPEGGVYGDIEDRSGPRDLEAAQRRKIFHVLRKARVKAGDRVLEFGTGWGGLAIEAARSFGCEVDTLTLSVQQKVLAEERIKAAGLEGRIRVHLLDYRDLPPEFEKAFDAFVSIEMIEHVGSKYYNQYFRLVDWALKPEGATAVISCSTFPESRYTGYQADDFMRRYMWPNSCLPSATTLISAANTASQGRFTLDSVENHSAHYPRTLREWGRRLKANLTPEIISKDYPGLQNRTEFDIFSRKWQYLFAYAAAGFSKGYITCHMMSFIREGDCPERCD